MPSGWRCAVSRVAIVAAAALSMPVFAESLTMEAKAAFEGRCKANRWFPLIVVVENRGGEVRGRLICETTDGTQVYSAYTPVELPPTSRKQYFLYVRALGQQNAAMVFLDLLGMRPIRRQVALRMHQTEDRLVLATGDQPVSLAFLSELKDVGPVNVPYQYYQSYRPGPGGAPGVSVSRDIRAFNSPVSELPDLAVGYDGIDMAVLANFSPRTMNDPQRAAMRTWVVEGGHLVVSGGLGTPQLDERFLRDLLPVRLLGTRTISPPATLANRYGSPFVGSQPMVVSDSRVTAGEVVAQEEGSPLVVTRRYGAGRVTFLAFDIGAYPVAGWNGSVSLWRELLSLGEDSARRLGPMGVQNYPGYYGGMSVNQAIASIPAMQAPRFRFVALFLVLYILCLVPVNYLILKKLDRRELAWISTPAIVIVFSVLAYGTGFRLKGGKLLLNQVTLVQSVAESAAGVADSFFGLFSPSKTEYQIAPSDPQATISGLTQQVNYSGSAPRERFVVKEADKLLMEEVAINMWSMRMFQARCGVNLGEGILVTPTLTKKALKLTVKNRTPYDLWQPQFCMANIQTWLTGGQRPLRPRQEVGTHLDVPSLSVARGPGYTVDGQNLTNLVPAQLSQIDQQMRQNFVSAIFGQRGSSSVGQLQLGDQPLLLAWAMEDLCPVQILDCRPERRAAALMVFTIPLALRPGAYHLPEGLVMRRIAESDVSGNFYRGTDNSLTLNNGSVTFEFHLPLKEVPRRTTRLVLHVSYVSRGVPDPAKVLVYNVVSHQWISLKTSSGPELRIALPSPSALVRQPGNTVRVRVSVQNATDLQLKQLAMSADVE